MNLLERRTLVTAGKIREIQGEGTDLAPRANNEFIAFAF